jgi:hypothetical protein
MLTDGIFRKMVMHIALSIDLLGHRKHGVNGGINVRLET